MFVDNTRGLCGTYNFKATDDFLPPNGFPESKVSSFADSYKIDLDCNTPAQQKPCETFIAVSII